MSEDITKTPLVEIITEMSRLDQAIGMKDIRHTHEINNLIQRYEILRQEVVRRSPIVEKEEAFKKKVKKVVI